MEIETAKERSERILKELKDKYPDARAYDLTGHREHFVSEIEPVTEHPEYDRAVEVIINSQPHKHLKMTQYYTILKGTMELRVGNEKIILNPGDKYTIYPGNTHWATSKNECWVEIYSKPGWSKEDHIPVNI